MCILFNEKLKTNTDTDFIKIIAIISMLIDHIGIVFFPQYPIFRWIGRIAFPIFCYCIVVGVIYTSDIKKYILRIGLFALISQPFYVLAFNYDNIFQNILNLNIFFTLLVSIIGIWSFKEKKLITFILSILILIFVKLDYGIFGLVLMIIFYVFREKPIINMILFILVNVPNLFLPSPNMLSINLNDIYINAQVFSLFAMPFIYVKTNSNIKLPKIFFYVFYPAHLLLIFILRFILNI